MIRVIHQVYTLSCRQLVTVRGSFFDYFLNFFILIPFWTLLNNNITAPIYFKLKFVMKGTEFVIGMVLLHLFVIAYYLMIPLLKEREENGVFAYHVTSTSYGVTFAARFLFYHIASFLLILPLLPVLKLGRGDLFYTEKLSWLHCCGGLYVASGMVVAYLLFLISLCRSSRDLEHLWSGGVEPFLLLGGLWAPAYALIKSGVPGISYFVYGNPFIYVTELFRQLFFHSSEYVSLSVSLSVICGALIFFLSCAYLIMRRRIDIL